MDVEDSRIQVGTVQDGVDKTSIVFIEELIAIQYIALTN